MFLSNKKVRLNIIRKPEFRADRPQQEVEEGGGGGHVTLQLGILVSFSFHTFILSFKNILVEF